MAEEDVDEFHKSLIPGNKKVEAAEGIPEEGGASISLHQPGKTSKPSVGIVESLATLKSSIGRRRRSLVCGLKCLKSPENSSRTVHEFEGTQETRCGGDQ